MKPTDKTASKSGKGLIKYERPRSTLTRERIVAALASPDNIGLNQDEIARKIGLSSRTIRKHVHSDPSILSDARELFHKMYISREMLKIDKAMLEAAQSPKGHADRKLAYQRFDGMGATEGYDQQAVNINILPPEGSGTQAIGIQINPPKDKRR